MFKFIKATEEFNTFENAVPAPYIRKSFICDENTKGNIKIATCGFYELFINGEKITKGFLAPYISNTNDYIYYDSYEVSLSSGENVIGIMLGNGYQNNPGGYIWDFDKASFRSAPMFSLNLEYYNQNGDLIVISTDKTFKTHPSAIVSDDYRFGENFDANKVIENWNKKGFDDSLWQNAIETEAPKGELKLCEAEPIIVETEIKPIDIFKEEDGYVYDFGISHAGVCRLMIEGEKGQKVEMQHTDMLKNGKFYIENLWFKRETWDRDINIVHKDTYILKGEGKEIYTPTFTYHGFRYVKVTGINEKQATKDLLTFVVFHSALENRGGFSCSNETVNKLQEMTRRSDISNFHYFPTDCPQREKNGWTADAALSSEQMTLNFATEKSYREWMNNLRKAQTDEGVIPGIVPSTGWGYWGCNGPAWDSALVYLPYYTYIYRGETDMIEESVDAFIKYLKYLESKKDEKGLLAIGLGDWCHVGFPEGKFKAPLIVTDTIISMDLARKISFMLDAIGLNKESEYAKKQCQVYRKAIRENLVDFDKMTVFGDCQSSQAMGLFYGVFEKDEKQKAFDMLLKFVHEMDDHIDTGVLGGRVVFHVLSEFGFTDLALKMIIRPDYPSYGNWIERGATTLWENFDPEFVYSPNHHFWGDISAWFIKVLAGINYNPTGSDWREVDIKPHFATELQYANAYYDSPYGNIKSYWKRENDNISMNVEIPSEVTAKICLPKGFNFENGGETLILKEGKHNILAFKN